MKTADNCLHLLLALKIYAEDNDGQYPTGASANEVFRQLIQVGILEDELIFGCPVSSFVPDGDIGESPDYLQAACPGEVHWMVADGLDRKSPGHLGLVFENSLDATWPPHWNPKAKGEPVRGRTWGRSGFIGGSAKVVIGRNDGSATLEMVDPKTGLLECQSRPDTPFPVPQGKLQLLDIEENKP